MILNGLKLSNKVNHAHYLSGSLIIIKITVSSLMNGAPISATLSLHLKVFFKYTLPEMSNRSQYTLKYSHCGFGCR